jgi:RND family efflux transporter MFP subunit
MTEVSTREVTSHRSDSAQTTGGALTMPKKIAVLTLGGFAVLGIGWSTIHDRSSEAAQYKTANVAVSNLQQTIEASGVVSVQTGYQVKIGSQVSGRIARLYTTVGQQVKAGQVIADLDLPEMGAQLQQSEANLQTAETRLVQQRSATALQFAQDRDAVIQARQDAGASRELLKQTQLVAREQPLQTAAALSQAVAAVKSYKAKLSLLVDTQQAQFATAQAAVAKSEAADANAQADYKRDEALLKRGYIAPTLCDAAKAAALAADADVATAQQQQRTINISLPLQIKSARQDLATARAGLTAERALARRDAGLGMTVAQQQDAFKKAANQVQLAQAGTVQNLMKLQDIAAAKEAVKLAQAQVKYYQDLKSKDRIVTPITGTVLQLASQQGETVAAGLSAPTLVVVADLHRLQVDAYVDETDIGKVQPGQRVEITVDSFPDHPFAGHVVRIAPSSTLQQNVVTYDVVCSFDSLPTNIRPDMTASIEIDTGVHHGAYTVPISAIHWGTQGAYVLTTDGTHVHKVTVSTGTTANGCTEITGDVKPQTVVIIGGYHGAGSTTKHSGGLAASAPGPLK